MCKTNTQCVQFGGIGNTTVYIGYRNHLGTWAKKNCHHVPHLATRGEFAQLSPLILCDLGMQCMPARVGLRAMSAPSPKDMQHIQGVVEVEVGQTKGKIEDHIHNFLSTIAALPVPMYRDRLKGVQILLSNSQAGPGRTAAARNFSQPHTSLLADPCMCPPAAAKTACSSSTFVAPNE